MGDRPQVRCRGAGDAGARHRGAVGRTGVLTSGAPEPVLVGGVMVQNATLHNQDEVDCKDVRVGDVVVVRRAGEVIPEVVRVIPERRPAGTEPFRIPERCPACGSRLSCERRGRRRRAAAGRWCVRRSVSRRSFTSPRAAPSTSMAWGTSSSNN
ncbi:MAG: hypothetical protein LC647_18285 [Beggiatoa sp.]|nr:hypothetical protein [Beggiatoa sp.]